MDSFFVHISQSLKTIAHCYRQPSVVALRRYLSAIVIPLTALAVLLGFQMMEGKWTWIAGYRDNLSRHIPQLTAELIPIPFAFVMWLSLMDRAKKIEFSFSPVFAVLTTLCFVSISGFLNKPFIMQHLFIMGMLAGLFITVPFLTCVARALRDPLPALVAFMAGSAAYMYYELNANMWKKLCHLTTLGVYNILNFLGAKVNVIFGIKGGTSFKLQSSGFAIVVNPGCSGLEGIFLFTFLLSLMFLLDWHLFKRQPIGLYYLIGMVYMFIINILRITLFFLLGYWAYHPNAWDWVRALKGDAVYLFHAYEGWVIYLAAFGLYASWLYSMAHIKPPSAATKTNTPS